MEERGELWREGQPPSHWAHHSGSAEDPLCPEPLSPAIHCVAVAEGVAQDPSSADDMAALSWAGNVVMGKLLGFSQATPEQSTVWQKPLCPTIMRGGSKLSHRSLLWYSFGEGQDGCSAGGET